MAKQEELDIEITPDGTVHIHVKGVPGKKCLDYLAVFEQLLGPVTSETLTSEYYEEETRTVGQRVTQVNRLDC